MPTLLVRIVSACARRPGLVILLALLLSAGAAGAAWWRLGVTTDVGTLFAASLPWKQREAELKRLFPQFEDLLVAVVDADSPEAADLTAGGLATGLAADTAHFTSVRRPDASPFFDQNGLLFLDRTTLSSLLDQTIDAQPFLGQLVADPSARGLFAALALVGMGVEQGQADLTSFAPALQGFHAALASALLGHPRALSWQTLLAGPAAKLGGPYRFVLAQPRLDYGALQPGAAATQALRDAAAQQEFVRAGTAHVRVTGSVALADEEFATVAQGAAVGLAGSTALVLLWLFLAVRSWRLIVPIVVTLVLGLLLTTGFAALAVGTLNLISVAFAILFVGIAVDFAIQFSVRFREARLDHPDVQDALATTAQRVGIQVLVAGCATAAGFLAFVPTSFTGVAELGLIAGVGMLIALCCTLTVLPAMLTLCRPRGEAEEVGFTVLAPLDRRLIRVRRPVVTAFAVLAAMGAASLPRLMFDSDPLHTKDPNTEAMRTLADLATNPLTSPNTIDILAPDLAAARTLAARLGRLPLVAQVTSLNSFVPEDQAEKLPLLADAASLLAPTLTLRTPAAPVTAADLRLAASTALSSLSRIVPRLKPEDPLLLIVGDMRAMASAPDGALLAADAALTRFLPLQIERLRTALSAGPVTLASIPASIARDWVLPDGRARVEAVAKPAAQNSAGLQDFVDQVTEVDASAGGTAVTITATAGTIIDAFRRAAIGALIAIAVILFLVLRRPLHVALVLAPLLVSAALTALIVAWLPLPLNFANVIALPLLLGVGVSFNIYFVMNWRAGVPSGLASATARAVAFSALTTATAFGSLALSRHPGTSSMGQLLLISLGCTLLATMLFVPALLAILPPRPRAI